jgi:hypothetical protein
MSKAKSPKKKNKLATTEGVKELALKKETIVLLETDVNSQAAKAGSNIYTPGSQKLLLLLPHY